MPKRTSSFSCYNLAGLSAAATAVAGGTAFATTITTFATTATVAVPAGTTVATSSTFTAGGLLLDIPFGFFKEDLTAKFQLAGLLVDIDNLDADDVAFLNEALEGVGAAPLILADVHQTFLAGQELQEGAELDNADYLGIINLTHLGDGADVFDPLEGGGDVVLVRRGDVDDAELALLFDIDDGVGLSLNLLDDLATLADNAPMKSFGILICSMRGTWCACRA